MSHPTARTNVRSPVVPAVDRPDEHFTRLWPTEDGRPADAPLFLLAVAPFRLLALAVLWATASPGRLIVALAAALAVALVVAL